MDFLTDEDGVELLAEEGAELIADGMPDGDAPRAGGGPGFKLKPIIWIGPQIEEVREEVADLAEEAAEIDDAGERRRIEALIAALNLEVLTLERTVSERTAAILAQRIYREAERIERQIEAAIRAAEEDDEEEIELLLLA